MAYLSGYEITGTVNINIHASDDGKIINSTKSGDGKIFSRNIGDGSGLCTNCTKFSKYSIASGHLEIFLDDNTDKIDDFTMCAWVYPVKYNGTDFRMYNEIWGGWFIAEENGYYNGFNTAAHGQIYHSVGKATFNSWRHYAITKKGDTAYYFKNGRMIHSEKITSNHKAYHRTCLLFRNAAKGDPIAGNNFYLDDLVFISRQCLWTSDYTVPEEPLIGDIGNAETLWNNLNIFEANIPKGDDTNNSSMFFKLY